MKTKCSKRLVAGLLLLALMISMMPAFPILAAESTDQTGLVSFTSPAIPASEGDVIGLSKYQVQFVEGGEYVSNVIWSSDELVVRSNIVTASSAGVYKLTASSGSLSKAVYLVVKNPDDTEYVLYENDFSNGDEVSLWYQAKTDGKETFSVSNGVLTMDSSAGTGYYLMVGMPDYLSDFGDYHISVDAKMASAYNDQRWMSVIFRNQGDPANYDATNAPTGKEYWNNHYQTAIRQTGACELTGRKGGSFQTSAWCVKGNYSTALDADTFYTMEVHAEGSEITYSVNGEQVGYTDSYTHYTTGGIGFHNNGCTSVFDNLKVTLLTDGVVLSPDPLPEYIEVPFTAPAMPANKGDTLDLSKYRVQFTEGGEYASNVTWSSDELTVQSGTVTAPAAGVYTLTAASGTLTKTVYLVVKNPEDTEYVLYENDFSNGDEVSQWWKRKNTETITVANGVLTLDASESTAHYAMAGMPDYLSDFGDYHITVDAKMTAQVNNTRWMALVFRNQGTGYDAVNNPTSSVMYDNYDQVTLKKNGATQINGRKNAGFTSDAAGTLSSGALDADTFYTMDLTASGDQLTYLVNGEQVGQATSFTGWTTGGIGFIVCAATAVFDNLKVTLLTDGVVLSPDPLPNLIPEKVSFTSPAIPATCGNVLDLSQCQVQFTDGGDYVSDLTWTSDELTLNENTVEVLVAGVYRLTATSGSLSKTVYLVVKNLKDTEYVLYENKFDSADEVSLWYQAKTDGKETFSVSDGELTVDSSAGTGYYLMVGMPDWLSDFGDYRISVDAKMASAYNTTRWMSVVFRDQGDPENYNVATAPTGKEMYNNHYQTAIRQTGACELTGRKGGSFQTSAWCVKGNYSSSLDANTFYNLDVRARGSEVAFYVNGQMVGYTDSYTDYTTGGIGFHNNGCVSVFDNVKITLMSEDSSLTSYSDYTRVEDADTGITVAPSVVTQGTSDYTTLTASGASAAIYEVDDALAVTTGGTVADVVNGLNRKVIPIFKVANATNATAVAQELASLQFSDAFVMSADADAVLAARTANSLLYGVLDLSAQTEVDLAEARALANRSKCRVVLLPASMATREYVEALQELFITVWVEGGTSAGDHARSVTTGANGIVTSDVAGLLSLMKEHFPAGSVVRTVQIIAHRGMPNIYPENSLGGAKYAYEMGATQIENDVRLTSDGVVVVIHDATIDRTANGTGTVSSMTYEELSQYYLLNPDGSTSTEKIPTLEEYFAEFKGKDVKIVIEIKTKDAATISAIAELVAEYDILDQINFITFYEAQIANIGELIPGASCGYLTSDITVAESDSTYSAEKILTTVQPYGSTFNPDYADGIGNNTMKALNYRGMTVWPYTVKSESVFDTLFMAGLSGMTINDSDWITDMTKTVSAPSTVSFKPGQSVALDVTALTYGKSTSVVTDAQMILLEGNSTVTYADGTVTATQKGTATVMFRITETLPGGTEFYLYTEPTTVEVLAPDAQWIGYQTSAEYTATMEDGTEYQAFDLRLLAVVSNPDDTMKAFGFSIAFDGVSKGNVRSNRISTSVTAYEGGSAQVISASEYGGTHFVYVHITGIPADGSCPEFTVVTYTSYTDGNTPSFDVPYCFTPTAYATAK